QGFTITMRLARSKSITSDRETFRAAVNAMAGSFGGKGTMSGEQERVVKDGHTNAIIAIVAGKIEPERERYVTRWQEVGELLADPRKEPPTVQIHTGPVRGEAQSFFHTLKDYPKCQSVFEERPTTPAPTPYGVPAGTVIAWSPSAERGEVEI